MEAFDKVFIIEVMTFIKIRSYKIIGVYLNLIDKYKKIELVKFTC